MMNKDEFLKGLRARISVLDSGEQEDILGEYAQHIDIRVAEGLTEEQAIQDFGDMDQLAEEILGAYHVDPAYAKKAGKKIDTEAAIKEKTASAEEAIKSAGKQAAESCSRAWDKVWGFFCRCGRGIRDGACRLYHRIKTLFHREPDEQGEKKERKKMNDTEGGRSFGAVLKSWCRKLGQFFLLCIRLCWNIALILCAVPIVAMMAFGIVALGVVGVLMAQGYPLLSIILVGLGGVICCGAVLVLGSQLAWRKPRKLTASAVDFSDEWALPEGREEADDE